MSLYASSILLVMNLCRCTTRCSFHLTSFSGCCNTNRTSSASTGQELKTQQKSACLIVSFVLLTCKADSSSVNFTRRLKLGLATIFLIFTFSVPSVLTSFMSTRLRRFSICLAKQKVVHQFIKIFFECFLRSLDECRAPSKVFHIFIE